MDYQGKIIAFEGLDGCGKTTQLKLLLGSLLAQGRKVICTREPGGTNIGEAIRELLLNRPDLKWLPESEMYAFITSMIQNWKEVIEPALIEGKIILCDRFYLSTMVYQGSATGINPYSIRKNLIAKIFPPRLPITHLVLDLPFGNYHTPEGTNRFDLAAFDFKRKVWDTYRKIAYESENVHLIDGSGSVEEVHERLMAILSIIEKHEGGKK